MSTSTRTPRPPLEPQPAQPAPAHDPHAPAPPDPTPASTGKATLGLLLGGLTVAVVLAVGAVPRLHRADALERTRAQHEAAVRRVQLGPVRVAPPSRLLSLPASLEPRAEANLYAQATGYVRERHADIGDRVEAGALLAVLDVPLLEQDLNAARAAQAEAEAAVVEAEKSLHLTRTTLQRWRDLVARGVTSQQELDERQAAEEVAAASVDAAKATVRTRQADVARLEHARGFSRVVAPFAGTITARSIDVGDYVASGGGAGAVPLFTLADTRALRVSVDVPQTYASGVAPGLSASVVVREAKAPLVGKVTRTSGALDPRTRTLRIEVTIPNEDGRALAGSYGELKLDVPEAVRPVIVPGAAVIVRAEGTRVAIVDAQDTLRYVAVTPGKDLGTEVEVLKGLTGKERVVVNMADELPEGATVEAIPVTTATPPPK